MSEIFGGIMSLADSNECDRLSGLLNKLLLLTYEEYIDMRDLVNTMFDRYIDELYP